MIGVELEFKGAIVGSAILNAKNRYHNI